VDSFPLLHWIIRQEAGEFQSTTYKWRPTDLLMVQQEKLTLRDMSRRYKHLTAAEDEIRTLNRADKYITKLTQMRLWLRKAHYSWKANHLAFFESAAGFYKAYGAILWLLKTDMARGALNTTPTI
jgi:predicted DCC family thiol-disulfide oxidoreductase YuxK